MLTGNVYQYSGGIQGYTFPSVTFIIVAKNRESARRKIGVSYPEFHNGGFESKNPEFIKLAQKHKGAVLIKAEFLGPDFIVMDDSISHEEYYRNLEKMADN